MDPLEQLIHFIASFIKKEEFNQQQLERVLPVWIADYLSSNNEINFKNYLKKHGKPELINAQGDLSPQGKVALYQIVHGDNGIAPEKSTLQSPFTLKQLIAPYKERVITQFLPAPKLGNQLNTFTAGHGSHTFGLINAQYGPDNQGITGIAPEATTFMIKAFQDDGTSTVSTLIAGLKKAIAYNADVVNLSLKVANVLDLTEESSQRLERILNVIPYVVAASGNEGDPSLPNYPGVVESYPARFTSVPFDVGAFDANGNIPAFCQYEPGIGPLFMAPGFNILSTGNIPGQQDDSIYVFMGGTSMAAPLITGFLALMLGEFKDIFSREQLLKTCYVCTIKLSNDSDWKTKTLLGALDMRMVLFTLHALHYTQEQFKKNKVTFGSAEYFDNLLQAITYMLFALANEYGQQYSFGVLFQQDFMQYQNKAQAAKEHITDNNIFIPSGPDALNDAVHFVYTTIANAVGIPLEKTGAHASDTIIKEIARIMKQKGMDVAANFSTAVKKRMSKEKIIKKD